MTEGAAFGMPAKLLATLLVAALVGWGVRAGEHLLAAVWPAPVLATVGIASLLVGVGYFWILRSRTAIDDYRIRQTWLWDKRVELADIVEAKFIYVPWLTWLIAPRLMVRTRSQGMLVFHAAAPAVLGRFALLSLGPLRQP